MFLLFSGSTYDAGGGWRDLDGIYATLEDAIAGIRPRCALVLRDYRTMWDPEQKTIPYPDDHIEHFDWWHIIELPAGKMRASGWFETGVDEDSRAWAAGDRTVDHWEEDLDPEQTPWWEET
jgi:hypothetical protein